MANAFEKGQGVRCAKHVWHGQKTGGNSYPTQLDIAVMKKIVKHTSCHAHIYSVTQTNKGSA